MENETPQEGATPDASALPAGSPTEGTHATTVADGGHSEAFPPFESSTFGTQIIWLALSFLVLYVVVARFALPRIGGILETRQSRIDGDLAAADASRQKTDAAIAAYEAALAEARKKSTTIADETRAGIKADIDARRAEVEADLGAKLQEAETRIRSTKGEALGHVEDIAAETVEALVSRLTGPISADEARKAVAEVAKG
jgi:F-type H+-transporting ATPase subunit b